jgi:exodeoxyribonuclease V beta subunit
MPLEKDADGAGELSCRSFSGTIADHWRVASFTSFAAHGRVTAELPDRDETPGDEMPETSLPEQPAAGEMSIFTFPKGAQAGIFLHGIFEELDFAGYSRGQVDSLALKGIERFGYDQGWLPHVGSMVDNVVRLPLDLGGDRFTLARLKPGNWLTELEFYFPLRFMTSDILRGFLRRWGDGYEGADLKRLCPPLGFKPVEGMVRGFMDMVFEHGGRYYLVDWKSNHLGYRYEDYTGERLKEEITRKLYPLQYLLYTVALNSYLSKRVSGYDYNRHFGGVLYFFLRGVRADLGEGFGVFRDLPPGEMIEDLTGLLIRYGG